jgi:hypothetical protein
MHHGLLCSATRKMLGGYFRIEVAELLELNVRDGVGHAKRQRRQQRDQTREKPFDPDARRQAVVHARRYSRDVPEPRARTQGVGLTRTYCSEWREQRQSLEPLHFVGL